MNAYTQLLIYVNFITFSSNFSLGEKKNSESHFISRRLLIFCLSIFGSCSDLSKNWYVYHFSRVTKPVKNATCIIFWSYRYEYFAQINIFCSNNFLLKYFLFVSFLLKFVTSKSLQKNNFKCEEWRHLLTQVWLECDCSWITSQPMRENCCPSRPRHWWCCVRGPPARGRR